MNNLITLTTGRTIRIELFEFDRATQRFYYGTLDVTPYLTRAQMLTVAGDAFDVERANREASDAARDAAGQPRVPDNLPTTPARLFLGGVGDDLAKLATDTRDLIGIGPENAGKGSPLLRYGLAALLLLAVWKVGLFDWVKKKLLA